MAQVDRRDGVVDDLGIKRPVRCAANSNVTLSGLQTIDGIVLVEGDRVLLTGQSTGAQNGIWIASTGNWTRPKDFDGALDCVRGTLVFVQVGSANAQSLWQVLTPDPITIDSTPLSFTELVIATGNSTWSNTRLAKTANYTVANADKGVTLALGGNAFFTVTLNAASGYDANFAITIVNEDAGRGKRISPNGLASFILWPKQTVRVFNQNNVWQLDPDQQRWKRIPGRHSMSTRRWAATATTAWRRGPAGPCRQCRRPSTSSAISWTTPQVAS
jgi:phage-related tail fiber protein